MKILFKKTAFSLILILMWGLNHEAVADHVSGGELTYTHVGGNDYRINLTWYANCNPTAFTNLSNWVNITGCGFNQAVQLPPTGQQTISPLCPNSTLSCSNPQGQPINRAHLFSGVVTLPSTPCSDYTISASTHWRDQTITTLTIRGGIYVEAKLNNTLGNHSSPFFPQVPTMQLCTGQPYSTTQEARSRAGGTLEYELIHAWYNTHGQRVRYETGYSYLNPYIGTICLDSNTGMMSGEPTQQEVTVIAIQVTERDANGNIISKVMRDFTTSIIPCSGASPVAVPGPSPDPNTGCMDTPSDTICVGTPYSFTINTSDADGDNIQMIYGDEIAGASMAISNNHGANPFPSGTFSWRPSLSDVGEHSFSIQLFDNSCPFVASNYYRYNLFVEVCCTTNYTVSSCCVVQVESGTGGQSTQSSNYAAAIQMLEGSNMVPPGSGALPDPCDPCVRGWYPVWIEDENGQPTGVNDPCITVEWLDKNGNLLFTGWAFNAQPDKKYKVKVSNSCTGCEWEDEFYFCCDAVDPGFTYTTECTPDSFIITVTNTTPTNAGSQFNLYTAHSPCTANSCMIDYQNPDEVKGGNTARFAMKKALVRSTSSSMASGPCVKAGMKSVKSFWRNAILNYPQNKPAMSKWMALSTSHGRPYWEHLVTKCASISMTLIAVILGSKHPMSWMSTRIITASLQMHSSIVVHGRLVRYVPLEIPHHSATKCVCVGALLLHHQS
jgi:hypothetical protein